MTYITSYSIVDSSPDVVKDASDVLIDEFENLKRELAGDMFNDWAEKF